jgi:hypothetical protein
MTVNLNARRLCRLGANVALVSSLGLIVSANEQGLHAQRSLHQSYAHSV